MSSLSAWLVIAILQLGPAWANTGAVPAAGHGDSAEVEEVEAKVQKTSSSQASGKRGQSLGRLHPMLVHFPIAWLLLLFLLDIWTLLFRRERFAKAGLALLALATASFIPGAVTGLLRAAEIGYSDAAQLGHMELHRNLALSAGTLCLIALAVRLARRNQLKGFARALYLLILAGAALAVSAAGHLGGKLAFGDSYFPF